jgi:ABC-2 type transport system ATP-binding protein
MEPAIRVEGLSKRFGDIAALDGVEFDVPAQTIFGLLGPNGAGKTTLFSIAASFLFADAGRVEVLGIDTRRMSRLRGRMTILPQDARFQRNVPLYEQLTFLRRLDGKERTAAAEEVAQTLELVGLGEYARRGVSALSHGMVKRLGIAQAFLGEPEVILLDEPTAGLDPANARQIRDLVSRLRSRATVVISSHNLHEIEELCTHVAILDRGKLVACGSVEEMTRGGREIEVKLPRPLAAEERARLEALPAVRSLAAEGEELTLGVAPGGDGDFDQAVAEILRALLDLELPPRRLSEGRSLERHFLRVTEGGDVER